MDFASIFSPEAGQRRRKAMEGWIGDNVVPYIPPEMRGWLGVADMFNPVSDITRAGTSARAVTDPNRSPTQRVSALGDTVVDMASVLTPAFGAAYADDAARGVTEAFANLSMPVDDTLTRFARDASGNVPLSRFPDRTDPNVRQLYVNASGEETNMARGNAVWDALPEPNPYAPPMPPSAYVNDPNQISFSFGSRAGAMAPKDLADIMSPDLRYSPSRLAARRLQTKVGTYDQFRAELLRNGAKPDELAWSGFDDAFRGQQKITAQDIQFYLDRNTHLVNVEPTRAQGTIGAADLSNWRERDEAIERALEARLPDETRYYRNDAIPEMLSGELVKFKDTTPEWRRAYFDDTVGGDEAEFEYWQRFYEADGVVDDYGHGSLYANFDDALEVALEGRYDPEEMARESLRDWFSTLDADELAEELGRAGDTFDAAGTEYGRYFTSGAANYTEKTFHSNVPTRQYYPAEAHFSGNPLFHTRSGTYDDGKTLFLGEIQSDWAQRGRAEIAREKEIAAHRLALDPNANNTDLRLRFAKPEEEVFLNRVKNTTDLAGLPPDQFNRHSDLYFGTIPSGPHIGGSTDKWVRAAWRDALSEAMTRDMDRVALGSADTARDMTMGTPGVGDFYQKIVPDVVAEDLRKLYGPEFGFDIRPLNTGGRTYNVQSVELTPRLKDQIRKKGIPLFAGTMAAPSIAEILGGTQEGPQT